MMFKSFPTLLKRPLLWATLGYLLPSLLLLAPVLATFNRAIPGGPIAATDGWQNVWNLWWTARALAQFQDPFFTTMLYYPTGASLHLQTLNVTNGFVSAPLTWPAGPVASYNLCLLLAFTLSGLGVYLLAHYLTGNRAAAFVAGLVFSFSPFHLTKLVDGQLELVASQWIPLFLLFLLRTIREHRGEKLLGPAAAAQPAADAPPHGERRGRLSLGGDILGTALFLVLTALTSWYYALFSLLLAGMVVLLWVLGERQRYRQILLRAAIAVGLGGLLLLPVLIPGLRSMPAEDESARLAYSSGLIRLHSADLLDPFLPSSLHPLWGSWAYGLGLANHPALGNADMPLVTGWNCALGYSALALALLGLVVAWRQSWRWGLLLLITLVLALGPSLRVAGQDTGIPLPYALLDRLPGMELARRPSHFAVLSTLLLALLVAYGSDWLLKRLTPRWQPLLGVLLVLLIGFEYLPQALPRLFPQVHPQYAALAGSEGALLDLPPRNDSSEPMQAQMVHGLPIAGGYLSRTLPYPFAAQAPGVRELWAAQVYPRDILDQDPDIGLIALRAFGFQHIVIHLDQLSQEQEEELAGVLRQVLGQISPTFQDERIAFYEIPTTTLRPFAYLGDGWYDLEQSGSLRRRWIGQEATLNLVNPLTYTVGMLVQVQWHSHVRPRAVELYLDGRSLGQVELVEYRTGQQFVLLLSPGEHRLTFHAATDLETGPAGRQLSVSFFDINVLLYPSGGL